MMSHCQRTFARAFFSAMLMGASALTLLGSAHSQAGVTLGATRIIFDGSRNATSIAASNGSNKPYAVQAWVNTEDDDHRIAAPFIANPPLFRLDSMTEQMVRIVRAGGELPDDRESVFYFNAQEIPAASEGDENTLKIALRTRIKLFYRPKGLEGSLLGALPQLQWSVVQVKGKPQLQVKNPSAFHVSFIDIKVATGKQEREVDAPLMVAPFSERLYPFDDAMRGRPEAVIFSVINDYGGHTTPTRVPLSTLQ